MSRRRAHRQGRELLFRNRHGEEIDVESISATTAKNEFGRVLEKALKSGAVAITRHDAPKAVLLDIEEYHALVDAQSHPLDTLTEQFDALLAGMQEPAARAAVRSAFAATPAELGKAAVSVASKRRG
jgi:antitoxin Phd